MLNMGIAKRVIASGETSISRERLLRQALDNLNVALEVLNQNSESHFCDMAIKTKSEVIAELSDFD